MGRLKAAPSSAQRRNPEVKVSETPTLCFSVARRSELWFCSVELLTLAPMMIHRMQSGPFAERARRSAREIGLAVALTFAAIVFVAATAFHRSKPETAAIPAAQSQKLLPLDAQPVDGQATAPGSWEPAATKDL